MRLAAAALILIGIVLLTYSATYTGFVTYQGEPSFVVRVIDGDTIIISGGERVRLIGVDTPEKGQFFYEESTKFLEDLIEGKEVVLEKDQTERDKYDRLLRYVHFEGMFVDQELVSRGYASVLLYEPDTRYAGLLLAEEEQAREAGKGIWSLPGEAFCLGIFSFQYNAKGDDNKNINGEYVTFRNKCFHPITLGGWVLQDEANNTFTFPEITVQNKTRLTVHTGSGTNNATDLYWGKTRPVWNNAGDSLRAWDSQGNLMLEHEY